MLILITVPVLVAIILVAVRRGRFATISIILAIISLGSAYTLIYVGPGNIVLALVAVGLALPGRKS